VEQVSQIGRRLVSRGDGEEHQLATEQQQRRPIISAALQGPPSGNRLVYRSGTRAAASRAVAPLQVARQTTAGGGGAVKVRPGELGRRYEKLPTRAKLSLRSTGRKLAI